MTAGIHQAYLQLIAHGNDAAIRRERAAHEFEPNRVRILGLKSRVRMAEVGFGQVVVMPAVLAADGEEREYHVKSWRVPKHLVAADVGEPFGDPSSRRLEAQRRIPQRQVQKVVVVNFIVPLFLRLWRTATVEGGGAKRRSEEKDTGGKVTAGVIWVGRMFGVAMAKGDSRTHVAFYLP